MQVYKITNLINGKIYVGKDSFDNPAYYGSGVLIQKAIKKYGKENFKKEILDNCKSQDELNEREIFWIKELNSRVEYNNYNLTDGGEGMTGFVYDEKTRDKFSEVQNPKPIYKYDLELNLIESYKSSRIAAKKHNIKQAQLIYACENRRKFIIDNYVWRYEIISNEDEKNRLLNEIKKEINGSKFIGKIYQYDCDGKLVNEYDKVIDASRKTNVGINSILHSCKGLRSHGGKYIWSYVPLDKKELSVRLYKFNNPKRTNKIVLQYDLNGNLVNEYNSLSEATIKTGLKHIGYYAAGKAKKNNFYCGFRWEYRNKL